MPHYSWRRSRPSSGTSSESPVPSILKKGNRSSGSSVENFSGCSSDETNKQTNSDSKRSPSPAFIQTQQPQHTVPPKPPKRTKSANPSSNMDRYSVYAYDSVCPGCDLPFDDINEARTPRLLPCLHTFCTTCLLKVYDYLEILTVAQASSRSSRPASRYSWRTRSSSPSKKEVLGHFICPLCHNPTSIFHGGGRDVVKASFPINQLATYTIDASTPTAPSVEGVSTTNNKSSQLLNLVVQEIQPKIRVIQKAVFETETAKQAIFDNVSVIEQRLMPNVPSDSEAVTRIRTEILDQLHKSKDKRLNAIIKRQVILKQCEKDLRFLYSILQKLNSFIQVDKNVNSIVSHQVFPHMAKRLSDLGNLLEQASMSKHGEDENSIDALECEIVSQGLPEKALAELSTPLYEKVVCNIPFLVMDKSRKLVSKDRLSKLSGGLTFGQKDQKDETVSGRFVESGNEIGNGNDLLGSIKMEVVPPKSGLAEIDLKYEDQSIQVRPSTAFIRPLSLESSRPSSISSCSSKKASNGASRSVQLIAI